MRLAAACLLVAAPALPVWLRHVPLSGAWPAAHAAPGAPDRPSLRVSVEPSEGEFVVYGPVAPRSSKNKATGQIALLLRIENTGTRDVRVSAVRLTYSDASDRRVVTGIKAGLDIPRGGDEYWHQMRDSTRDTVVYLDEGFEPNLLIIHIFCVGYDLPAVVLKPLKRHTSPVAGGSYLFPAKAEDLRFGEYWQTSSLHGTSIYGSQLFAYDLGMKGWDEKNKTYTEALPDVYMCRSADGGYRWAKRNEDWRVYGKPIYAMARGTVRAVRNDVPENPMAWRLLGDQNVGCPLTFERKKLDNCTLGPFADPARFVGSGNHVLIQSGDELHHYAHLQPGSVNVSRGATVEAGQYLGRVGNSGCSTAPHLHIDVLQIHDQTCVESASPACRDGNPPDVVSLRPLIFHDLYTVEFDLLKSRDPNPSIWARANDQAIPAVPSAVWPSAKEPCYYPPGKGEISYYGVSVPDFQGLFNRTTGCGYYPVWMDGFEVNGRNYYNLIFRSASPPAAVTADNNMSLTELNRAREDLVDRQGYRIAFIDSYPYNGVPVFSCIFVKDGGPRTAVTPWLTEVQHQNQFETMEKNDWVPMQVSAVTVSGIRFVTTLYAKKDVGRWAMKSLLTSREYDDLVDSDEMRGMEVVHLDAYTYGNSLRFAAIWHQKTPYTSVSAKHNLSGDEYKSLYDDRLGKGYTTQIVTGYESNNRMTFGGVWAK